MTDLVIVFAWAGSFAVIGGTSYLMGRAARRLP
jgi:hypothetical protein